MDGKIKVVELFAGVGGFRVGLEAAADRFVTLWADQWEPGRKNQFAFHCYDEHFSNTGSINVNRDIGEVKTEIPDHDLLVGGFPCQDYSVASSKAHGIEGKKGVLWWHINDILNAKHPKYVLLENVDRLVKSPVKQRGRDFGIILRCLADSGYYIEWRIVNAADYGLQQRRRRIFIFGCRVDMPFAKECLRQEEESLVLDNGFFARTFPITRNVVKSRVRQFRIDAQKYPSLLDVSDSFKGPFYNAGVMMEYNVYTREVVPKSPSEGRTLRSILQNDVGEQYYVKDVERWKYMKGAKRLKRKHKDGTPYDYAEGAIPFPDILDRAGRTMLTSEGSPDRSSHIIEDPETGRYRILTPIECERLNGFPDGWTDTGMTDKQRYFTMGNALVVQLITMMGKTIVEIDSAHTHQSRSRETRKDRLN